VVLRQAHLALVALSVGLLACSSESSMAQSISVTSSAFTAGGAIPKTYTCSGQDVSPPLSWSAVPGGTKSVAITVIDPDAPGKPFVHWLIYDLPASVSNLPQEVPKGKVELQDGSRQGPNDFGSVGYRGPCPPPGSPHHYHFKVYALDNKLGSPGLREAAFQDAIKSHVLATGELVGTFGR
jgi:Raf kinase inhibitor-like YbhB/YbcL family protein